MTVISIELFINYCTKARVIVTSQSQADYSVQTVQILVTFQWQLKNKVKKGNEFNWQIWNQSILIGKLVIDWPTISYEYVNFFWLQRKRKFVDESFFKYVLRFFFVIVFFKSCSCLYFGYHFEILKACWVLTT